MSTLNRGGIGITLPQPPLAPEAVPIWASSLTQVLGQLLIKVQQLEGLLPIVDVYGRPVITASGIFVYDGTATTAPITPSGVVMQNINIATAAITDVKVATGVSAQKINETATRKWAGETGANITETRIALGITNQGVLATRDTVDDPDIISVQISTLTGSGALPVGATIGASQISGSITTGQITGLGALATLNTVGNAQITDVGYLKLTGGVANATFTTVDGKTVTVTNGVITNVV